MQIESCLMNPLQLVSCAEDLPLAGWYAEPLDPGPARDLLEQAQLSLREAYVSGTCSFGPLLQQLLARFWLQGKIQEMDSMLATAAQDKERALLELIQGQLLISVRRSSAPDHLDKGFRMAANLLSPEDYFTVLKRHEWLRSLPLQERPVTAQGLRQLLTEAGVIRRLQGVGGKRPSSTEGAHLDTVG